MTKMMFLRTTRAGIASVMTLALLVVATVGSSSAFALEAVLDPSMEVFRIRCQIDADMNPATGFMEPKVQIQGKARADLLDSLEVGFLVENVSQTVPPLPPDIVYTQFELGSATADWDTFPDPFDTEPVSIVAGDFVAPGDSVKVTAQVTLTGQTVSDVAECKDKTSAQFKQQTKGVCKLKDFLRNKCKSGDILPDGSIMP